MPIDHKTTIELNWPRRADPDPHTKIGKMFDPSTGVYLYSYVSIGTPDNFVELRFKGKGRSRRTFENLHASLGEWLEANPIEKDEEEEVPHEVIAPSSRKAGGKRR